MTAQTLQDRATPARIAHACTRRPCAIMPAVEAGKAPQTRTERRAARRQRACATCDGLIDILAALFGVDGRELRSSGRSRRPVSRVRQIGMYVAHTSLDLTMQDVADGFSRDRSTVMHACHMIEDLRDDDDFDRIVSRTEKTVLAAFRMGAGQPWQAGQ